LILESALITTLDKTGKFVSLVSAAGLLNSLASCRQIWMNALMTVGALCIMRNSKGRAGIGGEEFREFGDVVKDLFLSRVVEVIVYLVSINVISIVTATATATISTPFGQGIRKMEEWEIHKG